MKFEMYYTLKQVKEIMEKRESRFNGCALAWLEDREHNASAYLGIHEDDENKNDISITFSIHNKDDFDEEWNNASAIYIDLNEYNTVGKIKKFMMKELRKFEKEMGLL